MMVETKEETGDRWPDEEDETLKAYRTPKETPIPYIRPPGLVSQVPESSGRLGRTWDLSTC